MSLALLVALVLSAAPEQLSAKTDLLVWGMTGRAIEKLNPDCEKSGADFYTCPGLIGPFQGVLLLWMSGDRLHGYATAFPPMGSHSVLDLFQSIKETETKQFGKPIAVKEDWVGAGFIAAQWNNKERAVLIIAKSRPAADIAGLICVVYDPSISRKETDVVLGITNQLLATVIAPPAK